ncbi:MAG TPA: agmatinase family protein [Candidatus Moranbacteria bacterium]|nr:agmatinase family protein [Candidatus Moranbacteria bacterium]
MKFNPSEIAKPNGNIFALPFSKKEAKVILIPVPSEITVSFRSGTSFGPKAILSASPQIDFYDPSFPSSWEKGIFMLPISKKWKKHCQKLRSIATQCIKYLEKENFSKKKNKVLWEKVNQGTEILANWVQKISEENIAKNKIVGVLGGDHSSPLGLIRALAKKYKFGILMIDAHLDLRYGYEGFQNSHASIMRNASGIKEVEKIVNVGARDFCEEEIEFVKKNKNRISFFGDQKISDKLFSGKKWPSLCQEIIAKLPKNVYISFDIDGLNPMLCPNTGTPVPGGLEFNQAIFLIRQIVKSGRKIIGFDLCEVSPAKAGDFASDWNAIVGSRILYQLFILAVGSEKK